MLIVSRRGYVLVTSALFAVQKPFKLVKTTTDKWGGVGWVGESILTTANTLSLFLQDWWEGEN
jgi:hypothetical protein